MSYLSRESYEQGVEIGGFGTALVNRAAEDSDLVELNVPETTAILTLDEAEALGGALIEAAIGVVNRPPEPANRVTIEVSPATPQIMPLSIAAREAVIQRYIDAEAPIRIDYVDMLGEETRRDLSPYEIREVSDATPLSPPKYLVAWCHVRGEFRYFRLSRIQGLCPSPVEYRERR